jgi:hypothetical protein
MALLRRRGIAPILYDVVLPEEFAGLAKRSFPVKILNKDVLLVSRKTLPREPEILYMRDVRLNGP